MTPRARWLIHYSSILEKWVASRGATVFTAYDRVGVERKIRDFEKAHSFTRDWIPIAKRMPPTDPDGWCDWQSVPVLVANCDSYVCIAYAWRWDDDGEPGSDSGWYIQGRDSYRISGVSHWMPLPSPPEPQA